MTMAPLYRPHLVVWLLILVSFAMLNVVRQTSSFNASVRLLSDEDLNWQLVAVPSGTQRAIEDGFENASGLMPGLMNITAPKRLFLKSRSDQGPYVRLAALNNTHMPLMDSQSFKKWTLMMEIKSHSPPDLSILD